MLLLLLFGNGRSVLWCAKDVAMSTILKVISLTGMCSSLVVAAPCFVGVDVVGGSLPYFLFSSTFSQQVPRSLKIMASVAVTAR